MLGTSSARPVYRDRCQTSERGRLSNFYPDRMGQRGQTRLNFTLQIFLPQWVLFRGFNIIIPGIMSGQCGSINKKISFRIMSNRVARVLYRSILKEIRGLTLTRGRRVLLLEEPDHKKWGHGQVT